LLCRAAKVLEFVNKNNSNWLYFVLPHSENFLEFANTKASQSNRSALPCSEDIWNLPTSKQLKLTALDERESA
jgi:hypothetical protein